MKRIVIAEDEPITRMDLSEALEELGCCVVGTASDGFDAIELCREHRPDVVLMDIKMPVFDGLAAAEAILAEETAGCVILLTAFSDGDMIQRAQRAGVTAYLVKPVDPKSLLPTIEVAFAQSQRLKDSREETRRAQKKINEDRRILKAQGLLAKKQNCSPEEAYQWLRKSAMDKRIPMAALADAILAQEERADPVAAVKRLLMEEWGMSEEKAYRRIADHAKVNFLS
ncbi:MAG: response regulator, partial [Lawsonibacter sp.]|nr:response regulator [Lawsonibacter sp.]